MNIFGQSLEEISAEARPLEEDIDILPGVPAALSLKDAAHVLAVSVQTVERMIGKGCLARDPSGGIPKTSLISYIKTHALADIPVLDAENTLPNPGKTQ
jgi:hypothetical protein